MSVDIIDDTGFRYSMQNENDLAQDEALAFSLQAALDEEVQEENARAVEILSKKTYTGAQLGLQANQTPKFTYTMMVICTIMMGIEFLVNNNREGEYYDDPILNPLLGPSEETLLFFGAKRTDLIVEEGDWWRMFMPIILHAGIIHLAFNMIFLYSFGAGLEREFGHTRVAYIFFLSGWVGIIFSALFNPTESTVGASGACYGLIGAAWAEFFLNFSFYKANKSWQSWLCQLLFGTILNLALGLIPTLDNFAHIGGFLCGILSGLQVLTLPRYDYFLEEKPDQWHQILLKALAYFLTPLCLLILLVVLYNGVDVNRYCPGCRLLNCLPTPLWLCDVDCSEPFAINPLPDGSVEIECPRDLGIIFVPGPVEDLSGNNAAQVSFCEEHCLST